MRIWWMLHLCSIKFLWHLNTCIEKASIGAREGVVTFSKRLSFVYLLNFSQQYNSFLLRLHGHFLIMRYGKRKYLLCSPIFICITMALPKPCGSNRAQGPAHLNPIVYFCMILFNFFFLFLVRSSQLWWNFMTIVIW